LRIKPIISYLDTSLNRIATEPLSDTEKDQIVQELTEQGHRSANISTQLAQNVQQYVKEVPVPPEYQRHKKVFSKEESHRFPPSRPWDHVIKLKEGAPKALDCKIYPMTQTEDEALLKWIKEEKAKGYIQQSKSPYASSFFFIKKKDGKLCPVIDYHKLNDYTVKNKYPLPLIPELIARVKDAWIFSKFDIRWGYNNICIKGGDTHKAAFKTKYGLWEPTVMPFRPTNALATFQAMMDYEPEGVTKQFRLKGTEIIIYMDDILIATTAKLQDHQEAVHAILDRLEELDLYLKPEKCVWESPRVDYLGLILEKGVTRMDPAKVAGVGSWPIPTTVKQVRSFLGFCNFSDPSFVNFHTLQSR
jgi:hypothetical protein